MKLCIDKYMNDKRGDIYMEVLSNAIEAITADSEVDSGILKKNAESLLALALNGKLDKTDIRNILRWQ